jgi:uncharacterized protein involved in exopolysaccharide biosynthesis
VKFTLRDLLSEVFRHRRTLIIFWGVTVVAVAVFYTQTRKLYDSSAKVLVSLGSESGGKAEFLNEKNLQVLQRDQQIHDEQQILQSHEVLLTTAHWIVGDATPDHSLPVSGARLDEARRFITGQEGEPTALLRAIRGLVRPLDTRTPKSGTHAKQTEDVVADLYANLGVNAIFDSDVLDVRFRYRDPQVAQTILQLILAAYIDHHIAVFQGSAEENLLKEQYDGSVAQYGRRLAAFSNYMKQQGVYADDTQVNGLMAQREKLQQTFDEAHADTESARQRLASLQAIGSSLQRFEQYSTTDARNKEREELTAKLNEAKLEARDILNHHPQESRAYQDQQMKLDELGKLLSAQPEEVVDQTETRRSKASELLESETITATESLHGDEARLSQSRMDINEINTELNNYAEKVQGFDELKLQLGLAKEQSERIAQAYLDSRLKTLTTKNAITNVSIIDSPTWDGHPATPNTKMVTAAMAGLLVIGGFAVLLACITLDGTVGDRAAAELYVGAPVVGTFPDQGSKSDNLTLRTFRDFFALQNRSEFAKVYQSLRASAPGSRVILLAETGSGEGASLIGYGLARFLSRDAREKTAFIDHTANSIIDSSDSREVMSSQMVLIRKSSEDPAGKSIDGNTIAGLSQLRQDFANIVVASGAVKNVTDVLAISDIVSTTLLIVEVGKTRRAAAHYSLDVLQRHGFQDVRLVLNKRRFYIPNWLMRFV